MIHDVDESLRRLLRRDALAGSDVELAFDAPTSDWAARQNAPTVNVYLYDIRENLQRREVIYEEIRDDDGRVIARRPPPRRFDLAYLVTAWTQRPEDEHRLLSACLAAVLRYEVLPADLLAGALADADGHAIVRIALPPPEDRNISDLWSALGGELKPSLDLVITAPFVTGRSVEVGAPVVEGPTLRMGGEERGKGRGSDREGSRRRGRRPAREQSVVASEVVHGSDDESSPGRALTFEQLEGR